MKGYKLQYRSETGVENMVYVGATELASAITCLQELKFPEQEVVNINLVDECNPDNMLLPDTFGMIVGFGYNDSDIKRVFVPDGSLEEVLKVIYKRGQKAHLEKWTNRILDELDMPVMEV